MTQRRAGGAGGDAGASGASDASVAIGELIVARDAAALAALAADLLARQTQELSAGGRRVQIALAGGRTPSLCYELVAQDPRRPAAHWEVWLGDERCVPPDDPASNFALVQETLIDGGAVPAEHCHRVPTEYGAAHAAAAYALIFPERLDVLLLGMGEDGHTASLFPGKPALHETAAWVTSSPPGVLPPPVDRVTLTFPLLNAARQVMFLVAGAGKARPLYDVLKGHATLDARPAAGVRPADGKVVWLVDEAAAAALDQPKT